MKKKISLFGNAWNSENLDNFILGLREGFGDDADIFVFSSVASFSQSPRLRDAENSIFFMPDYSFFDAAIVLGSGITSLENTKEIIQKFKQANIPVVVQGIEVERTTGVTVDNYVGMKALGNHLIEEHNVKDCVFIGGTSDHADSNQRLQALSDALAEHGYELDEKNVVYANWERKLVDEFIIGVYGDRKNKLPDAIVCANDPMAMFAIYALESIGYKVPEDVLVSGFDNLNVGRLFYPSIASVDQQYHEQGKICAGSVLELINDSSKIQKIVVPCTAIPGESCGCINCKNEVENRSRIGHNLLIEDAAKSNLVGRIAHLEENILVAGEFEDIATILKQDFLTTKGPESEDFHIYVNTQYKSLKYMNNRGAEPEAYYGPVLDVIAAKADGMVCEEKTLDIKDLLLGYTGEGKGKTYVVHNIKINNSIIGYMIMGHTDGAFSNKLYDDFRTHICLVLDRFQNCMELTRLNKELMITYENEKRAHQLEIALVQAETANKTKSQFLANVSHEIRTPINAILGMDAMILRESSEAAIKDYAKDIKNASNTLLALINDILDFSKIESGKMDIIPAKYQLDSVLNDLLSMIKPKAEEKGLELKLVLNPNTPAKLYGDEIRVKQVMLNLINNAVKYTKEGKITWIVDYEIPQQNVCVLKVAVVDTGIGIKPEDLKKIYSPYERFDQVENKSVEGTGLGLSITKSLLEKMDSELVVESTYGKGSKFSFVLKQPMWGTDPIGDNLTGNHENDEKGEKFHAPTASVLVTDDVEMNLTVIKNLLKRVEISPDICTDGTEAIKLANEKKYDVILLDAMMPNMSGEETLQCIRNSSKLNKETPIVVLTANAIVGAREEYLAAGFDDYLSKPINGELLENVIQKYLPVEKQIIVTESFASKPNEPSDESDVIGKLKRIKAINVSEGIKASDGKETYIDVCSIFYDTATARIRMISDYYDNEDYENYTIQTHALKSSARLIGALELSELAQDMELAGKEKNVVRIKEKTKLLLDMYKNIQGELATVFGVKSIETEAEKNKKELTTKQLNRKLGELMELVEAFDFETARMLLASLKEYRLPEDFTESYEKLKSSMADVNSEEIISEIASYMNNGKE
ncbi:MAG: substrate-binding domain-containing protein [Lachnospiraceae bacterium]|nr:substrate-binding domain-containing protein [Lachnospiraceae bacterium]